MKLTILSENTSFDPALEAEFGLSIYVEKGGVRLLFDTGSHGACLDNARRLGIDLSAVNVIAFSHNHWDHCGGFLRLADELHPLCPVYAHRGFFRQKWWDHRHDAPQEATRADTLEPVGPPMGADFFFQKGISGFRELPGDMFSLGEDIYLLGNFPRAGGMEAVWPSSTMELADGSLVTDEFLEEQVCVLRISEGLVVLTGCAHNGILNILSTVRARFPGEAICAVFGGTHLVPPVPERIRHTAEAFRNSEIRVAGVCHCTGPEALQVFAESVPAYVPVGTGFCWEAKD